MSHIPWLPISWCKTKNWAGKKYETLWTYDIFRKIIHLIYLHKSNIVNYQFLLIHNSIQNTIAAANTPPRRKSRGRIIGSSERGVGLSSFTIFGNLNNQKFPYCIIKTVIDCFTSLATEVWGLAPETASVIKLT